MPWKSGKVLVWVAICPDNFSPLYSELLSGKLSAVAGRAELMKLHKYANISCIHYFIPVGKGYLQRGHDLLQACGEKN